MPVAAGVAEGKHALAVLSGQGQDVQTAWLAVAGWPDEWSDAGRWRCSVAVRTGSIPISWAVTSNWGCPDGRGVRHVCRPASRYRVSAGGTDRRRRCPGGCPATAPWRKRAARRTAGVSAGHGEVLEVPPGDRWLGARADERLQRGSLLSRPIGPTDEGWDGWGQRVSASNSPALAVAAGRGLCSAAVVSRQG
jgi:hypothetical protein